MKVTPLTPSLPKLYQTLSTVPIETSPSVCTDTSLVDKMTGPIGVHLEHKCGGAHSARGEAECSMKFHPTRALSHLQIITIIDIL